MTDIFNDLWSFLLDTNLDTTLVRPSTQTGMRRLLSRNVPHNLYVKKDEDGNVESYKIEIVYTPFKSSDIDVKVDDGNLIVKIGHKEEKTEDKKEDNLVDQGISSQSYYFKIPMVGIDENAITAKATDGILTITMPAEKIEKPQPKKIDVVG